MKNQNSPSVSETPSDDVEGRQVSEQSHDPTEEQGQMRRSGVKEFGSEEMEWVELALAIGMSYDGIAKAFLSKYPEYCCPDYSQSELHEILRKRIKEANTSCRRPSYERIRDKQTEIEDLICEFPVMNIFPQVAKLQELFDKDDLKPTEALKVIDAAQRLREKILSADREVSSGKIKSVWEKDDAEVLGTTKLGRKKDVGTG